MAMVKTPYLYIGLITKMKREIHNIRIQEASLVVPWDKHIGSKVISMKQSSLTSGFFNMPIWDGLFEIFSNTFLTKKNP